MRTALFIGLLISTISGYFIFTLSGLDHMIFGSFRSYSQNAMKIWIHIKCNDQRDVNVISEHGYEYQQGFNAKFFFKKTKDNKPLKCRTVTIDSYRRLEIIRFAVVGYPNFVELSNKNPNSYITSVSNLQSGGNQLRYEMDVKDIPDLLGIMIVANNLFESVQYGEKVSEIDLAVYYQDRQSDYEISSVKLRYPDSLEIASVRSNMSYVDSSSELHFQKTNTSSSRFQADIRLLNPRKRSMRDGLLILVSTLFGIGISVVLEVLIGLSVYGRLSRQIRD